MRPRGCCPTALRCVWTSPLHPAGPRKSLPFFRAAFRRWPSSSGDPSPSRPCSPATRPRSQHRLGCPWPQPLRCHSSPFAPHCCRSSCPGPHWASSGGTSCCSDTYPSPVCPRPQPGRRRPCCRRGLGGRARVRPEPMRAAAGADARIATTELWVLPVSRPLLDFALAPVWQVRVTRDLGGVRTHVALLASNRTQEQYLAGRHHGCRLRSRDSRAWFVRARGGGRARATG